MEIEYTENPLCSTITLDDRDIKLLQTVMLLEELENQIYDITEGKESKSYLEVIDNAHAQVERMMPYYLQALNSDSHCGDCTKVCFTCIKCHAENYLGISTLEDIRSPYYVNKAFSEGRQTLDEAIKYLQDHPAKKTWEGSEPYVELWQEQQNKTIEDLIEYKRKHLK